MHRFLQELRSEAFQSAHPVLQASYAHYGLVLFIPLRMATAVWLVLWPRSIPTVLFRFPLYFGGQSGGVSHGARDCGPGELLVICRFMFDRCLDAAQLVNESVQNAVLPPPVSDTLHQLRALYMTRGGYSHQEVDEAGYKLLGLAQKELAELAERNNVNAQGVQIDVNTKKSRLRVTRPKFRSPDLRVAGSEDILHFNASCSGRSGKSFTLEIPQDCGVDDDLSICYLTTGDIFGPINEIVPHPTSALRIGLRLWAERVLKTAFRN